MLLMWDNYHPNSYNRDLAEKGEKGIKGKLRGVWRVVLHALRWQELLTPSACQFPYLENCKAPLSS